MILNIPKMKLSNQKIENILYRKENEYEIDYQNVTEEMIYLDISYSKKSSYQNTNESLKINED